MLQNIKVDVIYYKTNTDFEMEFNLCGCCRMRLLTDKSPDPKTLIHSMARAVSRSRVIIVVGGLFGEDGIIKLSAGALKNELCVVDNKTYSIDGDESIEILSGSTPLVTPEGYFGGCIIERGPQTLVLISDNKNIRKSVMQTLIHPYVEELSTTQIKPENEEAPAVEETVVEADEISAENTALEETPEVTEIELAQEEVADAVDTLNDTDEEEILISSSGPETEQETDDTQEDIVIIADEEENNEQETIEDTSNDIISFTPEFSAVLNQADDIPDDYDDSDSDFELFKTNLLAKLSLNLPIFIISVLLLITIAVLSYCIFYVPAREGVVAATYLHEIFETLFV